jgi:hypothetical protein
MRMIEGFGVNTFRLVRHQWQADVCQVSLAAKARHAVRDLGRGGQNQRRENFIGQQGES